MIECICINDKGKPYIIPHEKWIKKDNEYNITHIGTTLGTSVLCVTLAEITLGKEYYPYEGFRLDRFAFTKENIAKLMELMKSCSELNEIEIPIPKPEIYESASV